jgi:hypothetical protein
VFVTATIPGTDRVLADFDEIESGGKSSSFGAKSFFISASVGISAG